MKSFYLTRPFNSSNRKIASTETAIVAGSCLASLLENGESVVKRSTGTSNDIFSGFALNAQGIQTWDVRTEVKKIPATGPYTIDLAKTPNASGTISVVRNSDLTLFTQGSVATTVYSVSGKTLTFAAADAGVTVTIMYKYDVTIAEFAAKYGTRYPGATPVDAAGTVSILHSGYVYTDQIDTSVNWNATVINDIKTAANGTITRGGSGVAINAEVIAAPTADSSFLGLFVK